MLQQSQESYGPLPSELRPHRVRSRTSSRVSPYPARNSRVVSPPERSKSTKSTKASGRPFASPADRSALSNISINPNINASSSALALNSKSFVPFCDEPKVAVQKAPLVTAPVEQRQRVTSSTRRSALGWKKRASNANKENKENAQQDMSLTYVLPFAHWPNHLQ